MLVPVSRFGCAVSEDVVYLEDEDQRQEYVLAEDGLIWRGSYNRLRPTVWKYSQFERDILDCALHLMIKIGKVRVSGRGDPVVISRILSAAVRIRPSARYQYSLGSTQHSRGSRGGERCDKCSKLPSGMVS